jgi:hypothetical protein
MCRLGTNLRASASGIRIARNGMDRNRKTTLTVCSGAPLLGKLLTHIEATPLVISARRAKLRGIDRNVDR